MKRRLFPLLYRVQRLRWRLLRPVTLGVRVMLVRDGEVLLVRHTYLPGWYFPGGGVNRGESPEEAVRREAKEEVAATLNDLVLIGVFHNQQEHKSDHVILFRCDDFTLDGNAHSPEIAEAEFHPVGEPPEGTNPGTRRCIEHLRQGGFSPYFGEW